MDSSYPRDASNKNGNNCSYLKKGNNLDLLMIDEQSTMNDERRRKRPIAIGHLSGSDDIKTYPDRNYF